MAKIAFFELEEWEKIYLKKKLPGHKLVLETGKLDLNSAAKAKGCEVICSFIYSQINAPLLEKLPDAKLYCTMSTGFDHVDLKACAKKKITACNVPAYGDNTVAEHTFALILAVSRKLLPSIERTRKGNFSLEGLRGFDLKGKTLGVVGTGKIGRRVVHIARAFEMEVVAYDAHPDLQFAKKEGFRYVRSVEEVMVKSDIITLHTPLNADTQHMINEGNIDYLKKGAVLVNTSRGGVVETKAILKALKKGILAGAALDVLEEECFIKEEKELLTEAFRKTCNLQTVLEEHMLLSHDNVLITPHNAFNSQEALERILDTTVENINSFLAGKPSNTIG